MPNQRKKLAEVDKKDDAGARVSTRPPMPPYEYQIIRAGKGSGNVHLVVGEDEQAPRVFKSLQNLSFA